MTVRPVYHLVSQAFKFYGIPNGLEDVFRKVFANPTSFLETSRKQLEQSASSRQYDSATEPGRQLGQHMPPEPFTQKQQAQSRLDGGEEFDGTLRDHVVLAPPEPLKHVQLEAACAERENRAPRDSYREVPLTGNQLSIFPSYRLPFFFARGEVLNPEMNMSSTSPWQFDSNGVLETFVLPSKENASISAFLEDSAAWSKNFAQDVRFLHCHCHDHCCTTTCIKYSKNLSPDAKKEALQKSKVPLCRFFFFTIYVFTAFVNGMLQVVKRLRRRGKRLVRKVFIAGTNDSNEYGRAMPVRTHPFRSSSTDVGIAATRCNFDFQFMARATPIEDSTNLTHNMTLEQCKFLASSANVKFSSLDQAEVRKAMYSICAMHLAAQNTDYYITKYQSKDLEQLANVIVQYAAGIRRLEQEETKEEASNLQLRAKRVCIRLAMAANRSTWVSTVSLALFLHCGESFWTTHQAIPLFLSRPFYYLQTAKQILTEASTSDFVAEPIHESFLNAFQVSVVEKQTRAEKSDAEAENQSENDCSDVESLNEDEDLLDEMSEGAEPVQPSLKIEALRHSTGQFDDYIHRGAWLHPLPFFLYHTRVQRILKSEAAKDSSAQVFPFDSHYALAELYCQILRQRLCIPRIVGKKCPDAEEIEEHAAWKLALFYPFHCSGQGHCNDTLACKSCLFPNQHSLHSRPCFAPVWRAHRARLRVLAESARNKTEASQKIAVIFDTFLAKNWFAKPENFTRQMLFRLTLEQLFLQKSSAMPMVPYQLVAYFSDIEPGAHPDQMLLEEYIAMTVLQYCGNIDADILCRKQLLQKSTMQEKLPGIEDDTGFEVDSKPTEDPDVELFGGIDANEVSDPEDVEDEEIDLSSRIPLSLSLQHLKNILARKADLEKAKRPGRTAEKHCQMQSFAAVFHTMSDVPPQIVPPTAKENLLFFSNNLEEALHHQDASIKTLLELQENTRGGVGLENNMDIEASETVLHPLLCAWVSAPLLLEGPKRIAWELCKKANLSEEQIDAVALLTYPLQKIFENRPDKSTHKLPKVAGSNVARIIYVGSGGCGKSLLINQIFTPLLTTYFGADGLVKQAPSNKAARLIGGRTIHVSTALLATASLRTANLKPHGSALKKLQIINIPAGAQFFDEFSQTPGNLFHGSCLRASYARKDAYNLTLNDYATLQNLWGAVPILALFGDHLQLPPIPQTSSLFSINENSSTEHQAGCKIFGSIEHIFQFKKARRFRDADLIAILEAMREPGGRKITDAQWNKLANTEIDCKAPDFDVAQLLHTTTEWYHCAYTWNFVAMATSLRTQHQAREQNRQLFYIPARDTPKKFCTEDLYQEMLNEYNLRTTKKLPSICLLYVGMKIRFTTSVQPPFVVQDCTGTIVGLDLAPDDAAHAARKSTDIVLSSLPRCVHIKLDDCDEIFLPAKDGSDMRGVFALKPIRRDWVFNSELTPGFSTKVARTGLPLAPSTVCPLYSMQGTTAEGLLMHWLLPKRISEEVRWLIVYVTLSRVRSLDTLKSIGLTPALRKIIEGGPPPNLIQGFNHHFGNKIERTLEIAREYRESLGWPSEQ